MHRASHARWNLAEAAPCSEGRSGTAACVRMYPRCHCADVNAENGGGRTALAEAERAVKFGHDGAVHGMFGAPRLLPTHAHARTHTHTHARTHARTHTHTQPHGRHPRTPISWFADSPARCHSHLRRVAPTPTSHSGRLPLTPRLPTLLALACLATAYRRSAGQLVSSSESSVVPVGCRRHVWPPLQGRRARGDRPA
jgi:hypothetical protein